MSPAAYKEAVQPDNHEVDRGPCCLTYNKVWFYPLDPRPEDIVPETIAHALSMQCRFNGHVPRFYSVAEHCVLIHDLLPEELKLAGLLHDAAEAYLTDLPRPIKMLLPKYYKLEATVMDAVGAKFGFDPKMHPAIKVADNRMLHTEARDLDLEFNMTWGDEDEGPYPDVKIQCWSPEEAKAQFMNRFNRYL